MHTWGLSVIWGIFMSKDFKSLDEQLDILKGRGLLIGDREKARDFLYYNNYYRISGYSLTLRKHDVFYPGTTFQNIIDIYEFDRELRNILLSAIEIIEVNIKSIYAYEFSKAFGGLGYLEPIHFSDIKKYKRILCKGDDQAQHRLVHEAYLQHFLLDKKENIPLWAYVDLLTISDISILYSITDPLVKDRIAKKYGLSFNKGSDVLGKHMHSITILRNLCAHGSRLYNRLFITKPSLNKDELKLLRRDKDKNIDNSKLFGFIIVLKRLLSKNQFEKLKVDLLRICLDYPFVDMRYYGFCDDWKEVI